MSSTSPVHVGFAGLGAMGFGMATNLVKLGHSVTGFDVYEPTLARFKAQGGLTALSPRNAAEGNEVFICMVANAQQVQAVLFESEDGAVRGLPNDAVLLLCSTVPPAYLKEVQAYLVECGRSDICLVDCPVSGGSVRAAQGTLSIFSSGTPDSLERGHRILSDLSDPAKLYLIPGGIGMGSNVKAAHQVCAGIHIAVSSEAMGLAAKAGLNTREVFEFIKGAGGNSWMFSNRVPHMLDNDQVGYSAIDIILKDMGIVMSSARLQGFPLPLSAAAEQLYITAAARGMGRQDDCDLVSLYIPQTPLAVHDQAKVSRVTQESTPPSSPVVIRKIGFIGLGAMGQGMAASLVRSNFTVHGFDAYAPSVNRFAAIGDKAIAAMSPSKAAQGAQILVIMVQNASQVEDVLFGSGKAAEALPNGSVIILSSTVSPSFVREAGKKLAAMGRELDLVDAPVSGSVTRAVHGQLTIISSGDDTTISRSSPVLAAMSAVPENLHRVEGGVGAASSINLINQLLAGVHIAAAAEAMAFGAKLGLDTRILYEIIRDAAGGSWMFEDRVPAMLSADWTPHSALDIFVQDLGTVLDEAKALIYPAPLAAAAHQLFLLGAGRGWSQEADAGVVRVWELMTGVSVARNSNQ